MRRRHFLSLPVLAAIPAVVPPAVRPRFLLPNPDYVRFFQAAVPGYAQALESRDRLDRLDLNGPIRNSMVRLRETQLANLELRFWLRDPEAASVNGGRRLAYIRRFLGTA